MIKKFSYSGIIKRNGIAFDVYIKGNEIIFIDDNGGQLEWELNNNNLELVKDMIEVITTS